MVSIYIPATHCKDSGVHGNAEVTEVGVGVGE